MDVGFFETHCHFSFHVKNLVAVINERSEYFLQTDTYYTFEESNPEDCFISVICEPGSPENGAKLPAPRSLVPKTRDEAIH